MTGIISWVESDIGFLTGKAPGELEIHTGGGGGSNGIRFIPTTGVWLDSGANVFIPGRWNHVACVYDPSISLGKVYVNGTDTDAVNNGINPLLIIGFTANLFT